MGAPPIFFQNLTLLLHKATNAAEYDDLLDLWWDARTRASEWDAELWGLDAIHCDRDAESTRHDTDSDENWVT